MSKRDIIIFSLIVIFALTIGGVFYWAFTTGKIKPQASEIVTNLYQGTEIPLKAGEQGNLISLPYAKPQVTGLSVEDEIFVYKTGQWQIIKSDELSSGPAFLIKVKKDKNIYLKGNANGPTMIALSKGDNYIGSPYLFPINSESMIISYKENDRYISKTILEALDLGLINQISYFDNLTNNYTKLELAKGISLLPYHAYKINSSRGDIALGFRK